MAIDIGAPAIERSDWFGAEYTIINKENPANDTGTITSCEIWIEGGLYEGTSFGTFYTTNGNTLKCRDSEAVGTVTQGSKQTFAGLDIDVTSGDYIGVYATGGPGFLQGVGTGFAGIWYVNAGEIDPNDESAYTFLAGDAVSVYGTGEEAAPPAGPAGVKTLEDLAIASVKTINDTAIASVKTINDSAA